MKWTLKTKIALVENVRKYPFLYDGIQHTNRWLIPGTWDSIAEAVGNGATGDCCKRRWQILRNRYMAAIKLGNRVQPVGIEPHLKFVSPYLKPRVKPQTKCRPEETLEYCTKLTQIVREYPHLYFDSRTSSANIGEWQKVANRMGTEGTPEQFHLRWVKLRTRYCLHLRRGFNMKPSGIEQHLVFLDKQIATREKSQYVASKTRVNEAKTRAKMRRDAAVDAVLRHKHLQLDAEDEDTLFLFEFLQEMANMSDEEKLSFKLDALKQLEKCKS
uniref:Alcohol dehydrogenase transcription factor myb/sant-like protein n=1 Tax=Culex tarsalis TaxID=7177 RepID=A0A1Q3F6W1_CULTA